MEEEDTSPRKRSKQDEEVTRVSPPLGQKKDKLVKGWGKGKAVE